VVPLIKNKLFVQDAIVLSRMHMVFAILVETMLYIVTNAETSTMRSQTHSSVKNVVFQDMANSISNCKLNKALQQRILNQKR